jgi:hypothetical protein
MHGSTSRARRTVIYLGAALPLPSLRSTRTFRRNEQLRFGPYLTLHRMGFTMPTPSPGSRWALTPPFHPYRRAANDTTAVYFLWHFPSAFAAWALPSILLCGARTFLQRRGEQKVGLVAGNRLTLLTKGKYTTVRRATHAVRRPTSRIARTRERHPTWPRDSRQECREQGCWLLEG